MNNNLKISFNEGATHNVVITIPNEINLSIYEASVRIAQNPNGVTRIELTTANNGIEKDGQALNLVFLPELSRKRAGYYVWQLKLTASETDAIVFDYYPLEIKPSLHD